MSNDLKALQDALERAETALREAETARIMKALSAAVPRSIPTPEEITEAHTEAPTASPAAFQIAGLHLGLRAVQNPGNALLILSDILGMAPETVTEKLRSLSDDWRLKGRLTRCQPRSEREAVLLLAGMILAAL